MNNVPPRKVINAAMCTSPLRQRSAVPGKNGANSANASPWRLCWSQYTVDQSEAGLSASEISEILGLPAYTFLSHFKDTAHIQREKYHSVFIYFSKEPSVFEKQKKERDKLIRAGVMLDLPSDADAVIILATLIKHPGDTVDRLTRRVRRREIKVSTEQCRNLLISHDFLKKTTDLA